jgi:DnaK suppressor protein
MGEQQIHEHALHEAEIRLNKLNYVLRKVDSEDFGICSECEDEIPFLRLKLIPESSICVECAKGHQNTKLN